MSDDQDASNEGVDENDELDDNSITNEPNVEPNDAPIETTTPSAVEDIVNPTGNDYDDDNEIIDDYHVKLIIDDGSPDGTGIPGEGVTIPDDVVNAGLTDLYGNSITPSTTTKIIDSINDYTSSITQEVYEELTSSGTDTAGGKTSWWGTWPWHKILFVGLIALCIIGIILGLLFLILGKKFKNKRTATPSSGGSGTTTKAVVTKGIAAAPPGPKYEQVKNV